MAEQDEQKLDETPRTEAEDTRTAVEPADTETAPNDEGGKDEFTITMDKVEAVLNETHDTASLTPQMRKMFARQQENTKRVEETIKGTKSNPRWFVPLFCALLIIGLIWVVVYYLSGDYPIPGIGAGNLAIGFAIMLIGFLMTMVWR